MAPKKKASPKQLAARAKFAAMARARAAAAKKKKSTTGATKKTTSKKTTSSKIGISYYGDGKPVMARDLKIGQKYEWIMGAGYQEVKYIGPASKHPKIKTGTKIGVGGYIFQFDDGTHTNLSPSSINLYLRTIPAKITGATSRKKPATTSRHTDTKSHNVKISVMSGYDQMRERLNYGAMYDTSLQLYLVKFANLSFSLWAVTGEGLKKALKHPEGRNQTPIVYRVKTYGTPGFEKMKISELKEFK